MSAKSADYQKGYAAGRRRVAREDTQSYIYAKKQEFRNQALLMAFPVFFGQGWNVGGKPARDIDAYVTLAVEAANKLAAMAVFCDDRDFRS
jgi:hypothetical protein